MIDLFHCLVQVIEPKCTETTKTVKRYVTETVSLNIPYFFPVTLNNKSPFAGLRADPHPQVSDDTLSCGCYLCWYGSNNCNEKDTNGCAVSLYIVSIQLCFTEHYEESFEPWECELRPKILYHHK